MSLERGRITLLPDRTAESLAAWLKERGSVAVITRDRSSEYARGAALGAPKAVQVCDRWHLLQNLREMIERWLGGIHGRLRHLPRVAGAEGVLSRPTARLYAYAPDFPDRAVRVPGPSILDPILGHLETWVAAGNENAMAL